MRSFSKSKQSADFPNFSNNNEAHFAHRCLRHSEKLFVFSLKHDKQPVDPFQPAIHTCRPPSEWGCLMLFWSPVPFRISGALQHPEVNFSFKVGCSIYVNGLLGLVVCWAIQRQFLTRRPGRACLSTKHQRSYTHTHRHAVRLTIKSIYTEARWKLLGAL